MTQIESVEKVEQSKVRTVSWLKITLWATFFIAALLIAYLTFVAMRDFVASWEMTNLPGVTVKDSTPQPGSNGEALGVGLGDQPQPEVGFDAPSWDGANRVSMLVMGLDYRDWASGEGPPRTDTMILFTLDPINRTAGMLSIPRDLWVNIPGFEYGRINTAFQLGEAYNLPGGGPQLATDTVEELLGVPVDYYAQIDFGAFVRFIDKIGGVDIDVKEKIKIDPLGPGNTRRLKPGIQRLSGEYALAYARARKSEGGDFDRSQRQQQVVLAIRDKVLKENLMPRIVRYAPDLYAEISSGIRTNLDLDQAVRLAWLASQIPIESIKRGSINADHVTFAKSPDGTQDVLKPRTELIRELRDEIFTDSGPASPIAAGMDPSQLVSMEGARVAVMNGSYTPGLASQTTEYLQSLGINVLDTGNSDKFSTYTEITFHSGKPYTVQFLVNLMAISPFRIRHFFDPTNTADIVIVLGDDWAQNNPMP